MSQPSGTTIGFTYDADGNRTAKTVSSGSTTTVVNDVYQLGHLAYQTDGSGSVLATFAYDSQGVPTSVTVGSGTSAPRNSYVYNGHGDVIALVDATGSWEQSCCSPLQFSTSLCQSLNDIPDQT